MKKIQLEVQTVGTDEFYDSEKSTEWNVQHLQDVIVDLGKTKEEYILNTALLIVAMN